MPKVEIRKNEVRVGKKAIPLISGEVHYWRLNPHYWTQVLKPMRDMGLQIVSTYIPWDYHEYKRGRFDFTGTTDETRNLKGFLELTRREGFWVIIRPGPYIYSEWPNEGAPAYAYKYHRLHPKFLSYAGNYLDHVCAVLKPFLATRARGHIILLQADNELDPWPDVFGQQYGLGDTPGLFQDFLRKYYGKDLARLNDAWGTDYRSFDEAGPFIATMLNEATGLSLKGDKELKRNIDYFKFKYFYTRQCAEWNVKAYRQRGINIPIYLNLYPFFYAHDWSELQKVADMVGVDLYPYNELSEDEFEQRKIIDKIRYLKSVSTLPYIAEFQSGVWHSRHYESGVLTPNHYRLLVLSVLLGGVAGWNWYMLVNRDNWYMSPINEWGRVRGELYDVFKQLVGVFNRIHPPSLEKLTEIAVTFNPLQHAARTLTHNSPILVALYQSDIDYDLYDPRLGDCRHKFLFYSGNQWLETGSQRNLRAYVENGGTLIAFVNYPRKDDNFLPLSLVGFEDPKRVLFEFKKKFTIQLAPDRQKIEMVSSVFSFDVRDGKKITADLGSYGRHAIGYIKTIGKGRLIHLGVEPTRELVMEILNYLGVPLVAYSTTRDVKTALFKRGRHYYLIVTNNGSEDKSANVYLPVLEKIKRKLKIQELISGDCETFSFGQGRPFSFDIARKDGKIFEILD